MSFVGWSQMHGAKIAESEDTDWYGVYVEPPEKILGIDRDDKPIGIAEPVLLEIWLRHLLHLRIKIKAHLGVLSILFLLRVASAAATVPRIST